MAEVQGNLLTMKCKKCGNDVSFEVPQYEIINTLGISMIVWAHTSAQSCPACQTAYQFIIPKSKEAAPNVPIAFVPIQLDQNKLVTPDRRIVLPS